MDQICKKCGNTIPEGSKFCPECGAKFEAEPIEKPKCAYCGAELKTTSKFCPACGKSVSAAPAPKKPQVPTCAHCGAKLKTTSKFCPSCGKSVAAAPAQNTTPQTTPAVPNTAVAHMQRQAAQRGVKVTAPINNNNAQQQVRPQYTQQSQPQYARQPQQPYRPQYPPQYGGQYQQPAAKKRVKPLAVLIPVISVVLVAAILFTGLVAPGWMKGSKAGEIKSIYDDNSYVSVTLPGYNRETQNVLSVSSMALQAEANALLREEKFYRAVDNGATASELSALLDQSAEAWEAADVLCSAAYLMSKELSEIENQSGYKNTTASISMSKIAFENPFVMTAYAAEAGSSVYRMDRFDDAKEWAEFITRVTDHAKAGEKTAYLARLLKTDVKRAQKAIEMSQAILGGEGESQAHNDSATLTALQTTKTAGKVAGFAAATIASGGASMGALSASGYLAGGVDMLVEVGDTTLQLTMGEDHTVTKQFQDETSKAAPIINIVSAVNFVNPGGWGGAADAVGQLRFLADATIDWATNDKLLGISLAENEDGTTEVKLVTKPGEEMTPEETEKVVKALTDMGFDAEAAKEALTAPPEGEKPAQAKEFSEVSDEQLDQIIEESDLTNEDWEKIFQEEYEEFLAYLEENGLLDEDDDLWDYDPFMPIEDFPEDGDELGFDDISMWAKPENPGGIESEPEPSSEVEDEEEEDDEDDEDDEDEDEEDEEDDIYDLICGNYAVTETVVSEYYDGESETETYSLTFVVSRDGTSMFIGNAGQTPVAMQFDPDSLTGTVNDEGDIITFTFTVDGDSVSLYGTGTVSESWYFDTYTYSGRKTN